MYRNVLLWKFGNWNDDDAHNLINDDPEKQTTKLIKTIHIPIVSSTDHSNYFFLLNLLIVNKSHMVSTCLSLAGEQLNNPHKSY